MKEHSAQFVKKGHRENFSHRKNGTREQSAIFLYFYSHSYFNLPLLDSTAAQHDGKLNRWDRISSEKAMSRANIQQIFSLLNWNKSRNPVYCFRASSAVIVVGLRAFIRTICRCNLRRWWCESRRKEKSEDINNKLQYLDGYLGDAGKACNTFWPWTFFQNIFYLPLQPISVCFSLLAVSMAMLDIIQLLLFIDCHVQWLPDGICLSNIYFLSLFLFSSEATQLEFRCIHFRDLDKKFLANYLKVKGRSKVKLFASNEVKWNAAAVFFVVKRINLIKFPFWRRRLPWRWSLFKLYIYWVTPKWDGVILNNVKNDTAVDKIAPDDVL